MAPQQRRGKQNDIQKKRDVVNSAPETEQKVDRWADFKPGGKHTTKIQLSLLAFVAVGTSIQMYLNPPDRTRFIDSYRAPLKWYDQFADQYVGLATTWGYFLPTRVAERLQALHKEAGVDVQKAGILEIGAGGGLVGIELSRLGYQHIVGLDISPGMATVAKETKAYETIAIADAETLPMKAVDIKDDSLEAVLCVGTTGYLARGEYGGEQDLERNFDGKERQPERSRVRLLLAEWHRLLKPGGLVGITVESQLSEVWETELKQRVSSLQWRERESSEALAFLPLHNQRTLKEASVRLYFYEKLL